MALIQPKVIGRKRIPGFRCGRLVDMIRDLWYFAKHSDYQYNARPFENMDQCVDLGALESEFHFTSPDLGIVPKLMVNVYPNPFIEIIEIEFKDSDLKQIEITTLNGMSVYGREISQARIQVDLSPCKEGVYFMTVRSRDQVWTETIIKI